MISAARLGRAYQGKPDGKRMVHLRFRQPAHRLFSDTEIMLTCERQTDSRYGVSTKHIRRSLAHAIRG
jgi:hypothetical protein